MGQKSTQNVYTLIPAEAHLVHVVLQVQGNTYNSSLPSIAMKSGIG